MGLDLNVFQNILKFADPDSAKAMLLAVGPPLFKSTHQFQLIQRINVRECVFQLDFVIPRQEAVDTFRRIKDLFEIGKPPLLYGAQMTCLGRSYADVVAGNGFYCHLLAPINGKFLRKLRKLTQFEIIFHNEIQITFPWPRPQAFEPLVTLDMHDRVQMLASRVDVDENVFVVHTVDLINKVHSWRQRSRRRRQEGLI